MEQALACPHLAHRLSAVFVLALTAASPTFSHDMPRSESRIRVRGRDVQVAFQLNLRDLAGIDTNGDGSISYDELENSIDRVYGLIKQHWSVSVPGSAPAKLTLRRYGLVEDHILDLDMLYTFPDEVTSLRVTSTLDHIMQPAHQHLVTVDFGGDVHEGVLDATATSFTFKSGAGSSSKILETFVKLGIEHIFTGYDHLAFLVGLLIVATSFGSMLKVITSFTIAHSITLALATFDLVILPTRLTESMIALSIAYVAIENLLGAPSANRYRITFVFGLIHGFGFSNVLREMQLSRSHLALSLLVQCRRRNWAGCFSAADISSGRLRRENTLAKTDHPGGVVDYSRIGGVLVRTKSIPGLK